MTCTYLLTPSTERSMGAWKPGWCLGMCLAPGAGSQPAGGSSRECLPSDRPHSDMARLQAPHMLCQKGLPLLPRVSRLERLSRFPSACKVFPCWQHIEIQQGPAGSARESPDAVAATGFKLALTCKLGPGSHTAWPCAEGIDTSAEIMQVELLLTWKKGCPQSCSAPPQALV